MILFVKCIDIIHNFEKLEITCEIVNSRKNNGSPTTHNIIAKAITKAPKQNL